MRFHDRSDAGRRLAEELEHRLGLDALRASVILALPRGGVPVAFEVARHTGAPLDVFVVRKLGAPQCPEYGIGAVSEGGTVVSDPVATRALGVGQRAFGRLVADERKELHRRIRRYRGGRALPDVRGRDVVLVDDGLATGVTAEAALRDLRSLGPRSLILAAPVCARDTVARLAPLADAIVCVSSPRDFEAVGRWYQRFDQITDEEVEDLLGWASASTSAAPVRSELPNLREWGAHRAPAVD